jgi:predicted transcriptional regulator
MKFTKRQIDTMEMAKKGFCYDANPSTWNDKEGRKEIEDLVKLGLMEKLKNHSADKYGFYSLTDKGKDAINGKEVRPSKDSI